MKIIVYLSAAFLLSAATAALAAEPVRFASGHATVTFPDRFKVTTEGEDLVAMFGENNDHKLDFRLLKPSEPGDPKDLAVRFVDKYAEQHSLKVTRFDNRAYLLEPGPKIRWNGGDGQITYWMLAADNCMFALAVTAPLPKSKELDAFLGEEFDNLIKGISCSP